MADNLNYDVPQTGTLAPVATDDIGGIQFQRVKVALGPDGAHQRDLQAGQATAANSVPVVLASDQAALPVREAAVTSIQSSSSSVATIAGGADGTIDSTAIGSGKTGSLLQLLVSSSVPFKAQVRTVTNGVAGANRAVWFASERGWDWKPASRKQIQVAHDAGAGFDGFRVVVTNQDTSRPADFYCTFFWDEEPI